MNRKDYLLLHNLKADGFNITDRNKILPHSKEGVKHFIVKALIGKILYDRGYVFLAEAPVSLGDSVAYIDIFDYSNGIAYEVQSNFNESIREAKEAIFKSEIVRDVILIKLDEISNEIYIAYKQLEKIVI
ncbi:MAG: hypothetical protein ACUVWK_06400 [Nitrososphaerales archaeon]